MGSLVTLSAAPCGIEHIGRRSQFGLANMNAAIKRGTVRSFALACVLCTVGCSTVTLNPYGYPYNDKNMMAPGPLPGCLAQGGIDTPPQLIFGTMPLYPFNQQWRGGKGGKAGIQLSVSELGKVVVLKSESAENRYFADHAAIAMRDWRVQPANRNGVPVAATCEFSFNYKIEK